MDIIAGAMEPRRWSESEVAEQLGYKTSHIRSIVDSNRIRFERFGPILRSLSSGTYWLNYEHILFFCQAIDIKTAQVQKITGMIGAAMARLNALHDHALDGVPTREELESVRRFLRRIY